MKRTLRLFKVLRACEAHRIKTEKEEKKKKREKRKKALEEYRVWSLSEEMDKKKDQETDADKKEEDKTPLPQKILKLLFTSYGGMACLFLVLLFAGLIRGALYPEETGMAKLAVEFKWWFLLTEILILLQVFPGIRNKLYYEKNLLFLMTMPFEPMEVVMAKYLQILPQAYRIMGLMVLPVWLGVGTTIHFERGLNTAVLVACLVIPLFEMLLIFILVMLWQIYIRKLVRQSPAIAIVVPVVLLLVVMIVIVLLEIMFPGQILPGMARALGNILIFNFAWEMMIQGSLLLPLLFVAVSCVLVGMIFSMVTKQIYRKSLLFRWDLAGDDGSGNQSFDKMLTRHSQGWSLFLRELRTIRGSRFFAIPLFVSCFLVPVLVLLFFALLTWLLPAFSLQAEKNALETGSILIGFVSAQTLVAGVMNWVAATAWSRDAHVRTLLYVMPLESDQLLKAKLAAGCCYGALGSTPYVLLACIWLLAHKHMPIWGLPLALFVNACFVIMTTSIGMIREIFHPNFKWKEARELVDRKGNLGFLIGIVASILFPVLFGLLFRYSKGSAFSELVFFLFLLLLLTALAVLFLMSMDLKKVCRPEIAEIKKERKPLNFLKKIKSRVDTKRKNIV